MISLKLALRNILRHRKRNFLVILGIGIGISSFLLLSSISYQIVEKAERSEPIKEQIKISSRGGIDYRNLEVIKHIPNVEAVSPIILMSVTIETQEGRQSALMRMVDPKEELRVRNWELTEGRWLLPGERNTLVLGSKLSLIIKKGAGEVITIGETRYRVVGVIESSTLSLATGIDTSVNIPLEEEGKISEILVKANNKENVENIAASIKRNFPEAELVVGKELLSEKVIWTLRMIPLAISGAALLVSFFMIITSLLTAVYERTREIGILKALGATNYQVLKIFMIESFLLGFLASIAAVLLVYLFNLLFLAAWRLFINPEAPLKLIIELPIQVIMIGIILGTGISMLAGSYPAFKASRTNIVEALRYG